MHQENLIKGRFYLFLHSVYQMITVLASDHVGIVQIDCSVFLYYDCMKYQVKVSAENAQCKDPKLYCKFRPSCMIHFLAKHRDAERAS